MYRPSRNVLRKNEPRFLDYRAHAVPLHVALSFSDIFGDMTPRNIFLDGNVHVNGAMETSHHRLVCRHADCITVNGVELPRPIPLPRYFICYKPRGVVCSSKRNEGIDRYDAVLISDWLRDVFSSNCNDTSTLDATTLKSIKTVGRLDEESEGLLLLTNDGSFCRLLTDPEFALKKKYRVVARGSGYSRLRGDAYVDNDDSMKEIAEEVVQIIAKGNSLNSHDNSSPHFPYESCNIIDVGKLTEQHPSDDSFYILLDLTLKEGKRHAVRRIIKNSGLRVCYLSRIEVEGLEGAYATKKPNSLAEAEEGSFIPGGRHRTKVPKGELQFHEPNNECMILEPGYLVELRENEVDGIFSLRR
eukprot:g3976.t1 g3976   contig15:60999-62072(+)